VARTNVLLTCLATAKAHIEYYLKLSREQTFRNTILEEINLVYAVLILTKFTSGVDSPFLDATELRKSANLIFYLDALTTHLGDLVTHAHGREQPDYFYHFKRIFLHTQRFFEEQIRGGYFTTLDKGGVTPFLNVLEIIPGSPFTCDCQDTASRRLETPPVDDIWKDLLDDWPTSLDPHMISLNAESL
jgi:hypothetical protein